MSRITHARYLRHRRFERVRHSTHFRTFLEEQATRLTITAEQVFNELMVKLGYTATDIANMEAFETPTVGTAAVITGTPTEGEELTATAAFLGNPTPSVSYQWQADGVDIADATQDTYTVVTADIGANITCDVTGTNIKGSISTTSNALGPVVAA